MRSSSPVLVMVGTRRRPTSIPTPGRRRSRPCTATSLCLSLLLLSPSPSPADASSHWIVTEEGKIQAQVNSIFHLKRPYDLHAFLEQERRVDHLESLRLEMAQQQNLDLATLVSHDHLQDPAFEAKLFGRDTDCQAAGQPLTEFDLFVSTMIHPDDSVPGLRELFDGSDDVDEEAETTDEYEEPICERRKGFIEGFDDLRAMRQSTQDLQMPAEVGLVLFEQGRYHLPKYGHRIARALKKSPPSSDDQWLPQLLASSYWRVRGRARHALECLRASLSHAPRDYRHYGLLALANVLHRTGHSDDAETVLEEALLLAPDSPVVHFTMGNVCATLFKFRRSAHHFGECLRLQQEVIGGSGAGAGAASSASSGSLAAARLRRHAVLCHQKIEEALDEQQMKLQDTLRELRHYKQQHETWSKVLTKIVNEQATMETRMEIRMGYEQFKIQSSEDGRGQDCVQYQQMGHTYLSCNVKRDPDKHRHLLDSVAQEEQQFSLADLDEVLKSFEYKIDAMAAGGKRSGAAGGGGNDTGSDVDLADPAVPSLPPKYDRWPKQGERPSLLLPPPTPLASSASSWPTAADCESQMAKPPLWSDYPTVFLSPENKGFDIRRMMSSDIEVSSEFGLPLPWYPPYCMRYDGHIPRYDRLRSIDKWTFMKKRIPEREIEAAYHLHSPEKNFHEWGARVNKAMKLNLAPKWLVYVLAGTYWRIWGHPQNGLHCYRHALSRVPDQYKDVVLTNLAGLLYKTGAIDDALFIMKDVVETMDDKDPQSNFLLANLYSAKGNMSGAIHHYRQALRMEPTLSAAFQYLHIPSCHVRLHQQRQKQLQQGSCSRESGKACPTKKKRKEGDGDGDDDSLTNLDSLVDDMIWCVDGLCRMMTKEEFMEMEQQDAIRQEETKLAEDKKKKKSKKKRKKEETVKKAKKTKSEVVVGKSDVKKPVQEKLVQGPGRDADADGGTNVFLDREQIKQGLPNGAFEIGTIAETDDVDEDEDKEEEVETVDVSGRGSSSSNRSFIGPVHLVDDPLPDVLLRVREKLATPLPTASECDESKAVNWEAFTSTWLSVSAKGIDIRDHVDGYMEPVPEQHRGRRPFCPSDGDDEMEGELASAMLTLDHLVGVRQRRHLHSASESGLREAFQGLTGEDKVSVEDMAARVAMSMYKNSTSWILSTAAALYWRVQGDSEQAVDCLRHALLHAPRQMKDVPLISLANILHRAGLNNNALVVTNMALEISPKFVVIHFTMANIYMSKGDIPMAVSFYLSTLALQSTFEPARDRLLSLQCEGRRTATTTKTKTTVPGIERDH